MKKIVILVEIFALTVLVVYLSIIKINYIQNENSDSISMKEAYRIAYKSIVKEHPHVLLYSMGSADSNDNPEDKTAGKSGLRKYWNLDFAVPNTTQHWIVIIRNKRVKDIITGIGFSLDKTDFIDNIDSLIDTNIALQIAKDEYKLNPGEGWAIGYHFLLDKTYGMNTIVVVGRDISNNFARISINAKTKKVIGAIHKVTYDGVTYNWEILNKP